MHDYPDNKNKLNLTVELKLWAGTEDLLYCRCRKYNNPWYFVVLDKKIHSWKKNADIAL